MGSVSPTHSTPMAITSRKSRQTEVSGGFPKVSDVADTDERMTSSSIYKATGTAEAPGGGGAHKFSMRICTTYRSMAPIAPPCGI